MAGGQLYTVPAALYLEARYRDSPWRVFHDHGGHASQRLYSWIGPTYTGSRRARHLARIDIVVADPASGRVHRIIEIEDTTAKPKVLLGDLMAVLLGDGLDFAGRSNWQVGEWTRLVVLARVPTSALKSYELRLAHIRQQVAALQSCLNTGNAAIGQVRLHLFSDLAGLQALLDP